MKLLNCVCAALSVGAACSTATADEAAADAARERTLAEVLVIGNRPTSLPTEIPTTIEGVTAERIVETINATDAEDALKYFPSLLVRKRYIGDYDHAVLATRASGTGNSARSLVYADGILLSNLLGNGASFTPRWGLVTPEEIERVDVLYGPFSAAYPGNSVGAVVDYVTRMPQRFEAHARVGGFTQEHKLNDYGIDGRYSGYQASLSLGDKANDLSWWVNFSRMDSESQPITFTNKLVPTAVSTAGVPVTGAIPGFNPRNQPWLIMGTGTQTNTVQDHAKLKLAYDFTNELRASYTLGVWHNESIRSAETLLRDPAGNPVYSGNINIDGRNYVLAPTDFPISNSELTHVMHGLSFKTFGDSAWNWELAGSLYDYTMDKVRSPITALPAARNGGAGRIADMDGTGWNTLAAKGVWQPGGDKGPHTIDFGVQRDAQQLRTTVWNTSDWISGPTTTAFSSFQGNTELTSAYAQDAWDFAEAWRSILGLRIERWNAANGAINGVAIPNSERTETTVSPKAAISFQASDEWIVKTSIGRAVRNPTVSELYQGSTVSGIIVNNNPYLRPERSYTAELTGEWRRSKSRWRSTLFHEDTRDALYSQQSVGFGSQILNTVQNVDHIRTTGVEFVYEQADVFIGGLDLSSSLTYAHSRIIENLGFPASEGKWQPRVPDWRANLLATYRVGDAWTFSLGTRYSGRQYNTLDNSDPHGDSYTGVSKFLVMDLRIRYRIAEQWNASFGIDNLNNEEYWNFHNYPQRTFIAELSWDL
jgi:iron complex outermembrane receptor protein